MNTILSANRHLLILASAATLLMSGCGKKADAESAEWPAVEAATASTASEDAQVGPLPRACTKSFAPESRRLQNGNLAAKAARCWIPACPKPGDPKPPPPNISPT